MSGFPLSYNQLSVWYLHEFAPRSAAYHVQFCARIASPLEMDRLQRAWDAVVAQAPMLRTTISAETGTPLQTVHEQWSLPIRSVDARAMSREQLMDALKADYERPFDLAAEPGIRVSLYACTGESHVLLISCYHSTLDAVGMTVLLARLCQAYAGEQLEPPKADYEAFVRWQQELMSSPEGQRERTHWEAELGTAPPVLDLPPDKPRPALQSLRGESVTFEVDAATTHRLTALARAEGSSMFRVLLAACHVALFRCTEQEDILVGSPVAGRTHPEFANLIGHCVNMIVLRGQLAGEPTFREYLRRVDTTVLRALENQDYPFAALVESLQPTRDASRSPLFQVVFAYQRAAIEQLPNFFLSAPGRPGFELGGLRFEPIGLSQQEGAFDISLWMAKSGDELIAELKYNSDLFERRTGQRMAQLLQTILHEIAADPDRPITRLPLLTDAERDHIVEGWNDTVTPYRTDVCLHELVEEQVDRTPNAVAVVGQGKQLTYQELDTAANQVAHHLRAHGVGRGSLVGVYVERSPEMVPALLGVLKAGAGYVPLEPGHPPARTDLILASLPVTCVLTQSHLTDRLQGLTAPQLSHLVCVDDGSADDVAEGRLTVAIATDLGKEVETRPTQQSDPGDTAYIIFTSGSTGVPKGVEVAHRPVVNLIEWVTKAYGVGTADRILQVTSLCFDLSVYDMFGGLAAGASLHVPSSDELRDPRRLVELVCGGEITFWNSAPPALQQLVPFLPTDAPASSLRLVFLSGDWIPLPLPDQIRTVFPRAHVVSLGGATEATVWSNVYDIGEIESRWVSIPYGRPIQNARYYVLDPHGNPCPVGIPGELFIGGDVLAKGYTDPDLTAAKFVPDPFRPDGLMYRTGDRARFYSDSNLEFLGRKDFQVKVRGYRIELGEIEAALLAHEGVAECLVMARDDVGSDRELVSYVVPSGAGELSAGELRSFVGERLPHYMVPTHFVVLPAMPMTSNGKIDRKALPAPERRRDTTTEFVEPRDDTERLVADIWRRALEVDRIGAADDFFALGGHSLQAVEIVHLLEEATGRQLPLSVLLQAPTVAELAAHLGSSGETAALLVPLRAGTGTPLFCVHPSGGEVLAYRTLAELLPDSRPVLGVQSRALSRLDEHDDLHTMADEYAAALVAAQPNGPFLLVGWSMGGVLAHAVAQRLVAAGRAVGFVGLIDAVLPSEQADLLEHPFWRLGAAFGALAGAVSELDGELRQRVVETVLGRPANERRTAALRFAVDHGLLPEGTNLGALEGASVLTAKHEQLLLAYEPRLLQLALSAWFASDTLLDGRPPTDWARHTNGPVDVRIVPGNHYTIVRPPAVERIASQLGRLLEARHSSLI